MKAVILAGGLGTRISEETHLKPKPMIEIGGKPILWHIMKTYSFYGINDFIICCGYKGNVIKEYFSSYFLQNSDITFDLSNNEIEIHSLKSEPWKVTLADTGEFTMTGGRLKRVRPYLRDDEPFCFTYGDGLADIDIPALINFHMAHGRLATVTSVLQPSRYGVLGRVGFEVRTVDEKPIDQGAWINGGYFVLSPKVLDLIEGDGTPWELEPMSQLASLGQLCAFEHKGFWHSMDTLRERVALEALWNSGSPPWKRW